jgi:hypothetical protein
MYESHSSTLPPFQKAVQIHLANWEHWFPKKFIITTTPSENLLNIKVKIEMTDTGIKGSTSGLSTAVLQTFLSTPSMSNQITFQLVTSPPLSLSTMSMEL